MKKTKTISREYICLQCGVRKTSTSKRGPVPKYCSRECMLRSAGHTLISDNRKCKECGRVFLTRQKPGRPQVFCSKECRAESIRNKPPYTYSRTCCICKMEFIGRANKKTCSSVCLKKRRDDIVRPLRKTKAEKRKTRLRLWAVGSSRRRARLRGVKAERVCRVDIFERDKWLCQLCGTVTLRSKQGTDHDRAPELDHIIPISKGGPHAEHNVQCTCRKCNRGKSNKVIGQLRINLNTN